MVVRTRILCNLPSFVVCGVSGPQGPGPAAPFVPAATQPQGVQTHKRNLNQTASTYKYFCADLVVNHTQQWL